MKPLRPISFATADFEGKRWQLGGGGIDVLRHIRLTAAEFPSVLLAYSASPGSGPFSRSLAEDITELGINVFLSTTPAPITALSLILAQRQMPLGLYLHETQDDSWELLPVAIHGGPVDESHVSGHETHFAAKIGVLGEADLLTPYLEKLSGLIDPLPEDGLGVSALESPFAAIASMTARLPKLSIFSRRSPEGPIAVISPDGQSLALRHSSGEVIPTVALVATIGRYLTQVRKSSGAVIGPLEWKADMRDIAEYRAVTGDALDMSNHASIADLLLGCWEPGIIAHQGHSPFGDAYLSLAYLTEAWSCGIDVPRQKNLAG
jgi:hypothetical protein